MCFGRDERHTPRKLLQSQPVTLCAVERVTTIATTASPYSPPAARDARRQVVAWVPGGLRVVLAVTIGVGGDISLISLR